MENQKFDINKLRVASPCSVSWETMTGDERVRQCHSCKLDIYNITEMTKAEVKNLIENREERLCVRLYKRADGTVLTKDCPVGFRAYQKRISRFAGATLAAILGLFSVSFGQNKDTNPVDISKTEIEKTSQNEKGNLFVKVTDSNGAPVPKADLILIQTDTKIELKARSDSNGVYTFSFLPKGVYKIEASSKNSNISSYENVLVTSGRTTLIDIILYPKGTKIEVGIIGHEPTMDTSSSTVEKVITRRMIDLLPH